MNAEIVRLGTMYVDGVPRNPGFSYQGESVSFGDTVDETIPTSGTTP